MNVQVNTMNKDDVEKTSLELERDGLIKQFKSIEDEVNNSNKGIFEEFIARFNYSEITVTRSSDSTSNTTGVVGKEEGKGINPELEDVLNQILVERIEKLDIQYVKLRVIEIISSKLHSEKQNEFIRQNFALLSELIKEKRKVIFELMEIEF